MKYEVKSSGKNEMGDNAEGWQNKSRYKIVVSKSGVLKSLKK